MKFLISAFIKGVNPIKAKQRSTPKIIIPNAPNGTKPISTLESLSFSHNNEPTTIPIEKMVKNNVTIEESPPTTSLVNNGNWASNVAPKNQNHEIAKIDLKTEDFSLAILITSMLCLNILKLTF